MEKEDIVHSQPMPTGKEQTVPAGIEGIVLSNFDIANEEEKKHSQQNKLQSNALPETVRTPAGDTKQTTKTRRRRRSYDYNFGINRDDVNECRDDIKDSVCAGLFHVCWCLCCNGDGECR